MSLLELAQLRTLDLGLDIAGETAPDGISPQNVDVVAVGAGPLARLSHFCISLRPRMRTLITGRR